MVTLKHSKGRGKSGKTVYVLIVPLWNRNTKKKALPPSLRATPFNDIHHQSRQKIMRVAYFISLMREFGIREAI